MIKYNMQQRSANTEKIMKREPHHSGIKSAHKLDKHSP